jgi:sortase A
LPVRVKIPKIKVDADVEYVGLAPDGAMDVPKNYDNTAWYQLGPRPGERGNAAIAGHVDSKTGRAVFWDLPKLRPGDEVFVVGDDGVERKFVVREIQTYKRTDAPLDRIFGPTSNRHLNLITCDSTSSFNRTTQEYAANVVVYTELVDGP